VMETLMKVFVDTQLAEDFALHEKDSQLPQVNLFLPMYS